MTEIVPQNNAPAESIETHSTEAVVKTETKESSTPHISIKAEEVFRIGNFPVTNSLIATWIVMVFLLVLVLFYNKKSGKVYILLNMVMKGVYGLLAPIFGDKARVFFPLSMTIFLFVLMLNWFGLLPGVNTIGIEGAHGFLPVLRGGTADLNMTFALALFGMFMVQFYAVKYLGVKGYIKKFINLTNPIYAFVGILDILSEFSKVLSFAFRLFGNIFAGEVLLTVIAFLVPVLASLPFLLFEFFVGFMQALVFAMLLSIFLTVSSSHGH
ncbi:MAG: F0F1 ATP synthase subunit A [Patescibacteria group bacterium]|jgi:F-type H+-transporting ATPase subunit a